MPPKGEAALDTAMPGSSPVAAAPNDTCGDGGARGTPVEATVAAGGATASAPPAAASAPPAAASAALPAASAPVVASAPPAAASAIPAAANAPS